MAVESEQHRADAKHLADNSTDRSVSNTIAKPHRRIYKTGVSDNPAWVSFVPVSECRSADNGEDFNDEVEEIGFKSEYDKVQGVDNQIGYNESNQPNRFIRPESFPVGVYKATEDTD